MRRLVENPKIEWTDEIDFPLMVEEFSKNRFIDNLKYLKKETSYSHIVLLADHWGSMLSYEYIEDHISHSIRSIPECNFEHYVFQNLPEYDSRSKGYKMLKVNSGDKKTESLKPGWNKDTRIFILSDGGGLSGIVNKQRMRASFKFWRYLKSKTNHVFWINPVSKIHREGTTAERLNRVIPMIFPIESELNIFFNKT